MNFPQSLVRKESVWGNCGEKKEYFKISLFFLCLLVLFFPEVFFKGDLLVKGDPMGRHLAAFRSLLNNKSLVWTPNICMGYPFMISPILGFFSPLILLSYGFSAIFAPQIVLTYTTLVLYFFAMLFMYIYMRSLSLSKISACFSAVMFAFNGFMWNYINIISGLNTFIWLPLVLACIEFYFSKKMKLYYAILAGVILGVLFLGGQLQYAYYSLFLVIPYYIFKIFQIKERIRIYHWIILILIFIIAFGISTIELLPLKELISLSARKLSSFSDIAMEDAFHNGKNLLSMFLYIPKFRLQPTDDMYPLYMGLIPGLLIILAFFSKKQKRYILFYILVILFAVVFSYEKTSFFYHALYKINFIGFNMFKRPQRLVFLLVFAASVLSGFGIDRLSRFFKNKKLLVSIKLLLLGMGVIGLLQISTKEGFKGEALISKKDLRYLFSHMIPITIIQDSKRDLVRYAVLSRVEDFYCGLYNFALIQGGQETSGSTVIPLQRYLEYTSASLNIRTLMTSEDLQTDFISYPNLFKLTNTRYAIVPYHIDASLVENNKFFKKTFEDNFIEVYLYSDYLPRAFFVQQAIVIKDKQKILDTLKDSNFNPEKTVILEEDIPYTQALSLRPYFLAITNYTPNKVEITLSNQTSGFLILLDTNYPGWKATLDNQPTKIYQADYLFRAVYIPSPGNHKIAFIYQPKSFYVGAFISLFTLIGCGVGMRKGRRE